MDLDHRQGPIDAAPRAGDSPMAWWRSLRPVGPVAAPLPSTCSWESGSRDVDAEIDAGAAAILLVSDTSAGFHARALAALFAAVDATAVTPKSVDDLAWMLACAAIRDAIPPLRRHADDPATLLSADPELAWLTAAIYRSAERHTPVVIAGALPTIALLCAQRIGDAITTWVQIGMEDDDVAARAAQRRLGKTPWMSSILPLDRSSRIELMRTALASLDGLRPEDLSD